MLTKRTNVEIGKPHTLHWVVESEQPKYGPEVVDWWVDHPDDCMVEDEASDADGKIVWAAQYPECAVAFVLEGEGFEFFQESLDPGDIDVKTEGEHTLNFTYKYEYFPPTYWNGDEPDYDIEITKCPEENDTTASMPPAST